MFARLLLIVLVAVAATLLWRRARTELQAPRRPRSIDAKTVRCAHCQVYLPSQDAVVHDGQSYCSREHAARGARAP